VNATADDATADTPAAIAARELLPGERVQWAARPRPWAAARQTLMALPIGLFLMAVGAFAVDVVPRALLVPSDVLALLPIRSVGALVALLGLAAACAPLATALLARGTVYAVTTRRLLVIDRAFVHRVASFAPEDVQAIMVANERYDGSADIVFRQEIRYVRMSRGGRYGVVRKIGFFGIEDAERVRDLIRAMRGDVANAPSFLEP
jgi:hypothetical protein